MPGTLTPLRAFFSYSNFDWPSRLSGPYHLDGPGAFDYREAVVKYFSTSVTTLGLIFGFAALNVIDGWSIWWIWLGIALAIFFETLSKVEFRGATVNRSPGYVPTSKGHYGPGEHPPSANG